MIAAFHRARHRILARGEQKELPYCACRHVSPQSIPSRGSSGTAMRSSIQYAHAVRFEPITLLTDHPTAPGPRARRTGAMALAASKLMVVAGVAVGAAMAQRWPIEDAETDDTFFWFMMNSSFSMARFVVPECARLQLQADRQVLVF